ncbi:MAG TPA: T9SS type A sorting domain-containing protein [Prolixibacteraceae bacterium]
MYKTYPQSSAHDGITVSMESFTSLIQQSKSMQNLIQAFKSFALFTFLFISSFSVLGAKWQTIKLFATFNLQNSYTTIAFNRDMTKGLDPTYDSGLLGGGSDLLIYSFLVQDYPGVKFAIQALPDYGYSTITIPIGLDFKTGGTVVFSAELLNIPSDCKVILEDKVTNTFTDLSKNTYQLAISANSSIINRLQLHYSPAPIWLGTTNTDWSTPVNWNTNAVPSASDNVTISTSSNQPIVNESPASPAVCRNLTIESGAVLTIAPGKALSVNNILTNNSLGGIFIRSDVSGTGSLIAGSAYGTGSAVAERYMTSGAWHIVSSPLWGEDVSTFLSSNPNVPLKNGNRGMMDYDPASNRWNNYFTNSSSGILLGACKGFSMRTETDAAVQFKGSIQAGPQSAAGAAGFWNCIGNPYTSAIGINSNNSSSVDFLTENAANLESSFGAIYIWNKPDAFNGQTGNYTAINNTSSAFDVQQGQAFMVKMKTSAVDFKPAMQIHDPELALKSAKTPWPTIKLVATVNSQKSSTIIAFHSAMTKGLDPTYDAGLLKGASDLIVYSKLVEDIGIQFAIQALPDNDFKGLIIPVGIDFKTGGEVIFSAELLNLPADCKVILEDKLSKTFTDLSSGVYKTAIASNSIIPDRFQLHTSTLTVSELGNDILNGKWHAFAIRNIELRIVGEVSSEAVATLYNIQGKIVLIENLNEGNLNIIPTPNIKNGIYLLSVKDKSKLQTFKLLVRD